MSLNLNLNLRCMKYDYHTDSSAGIIYLSHGDFLYLSRVATDQSLRDLSRDLNHKVIDQSLRDLNCKAIDQSLRDLKKGSHDTTDSVPIVVKDVVFCGIPSNRIDAGAYSMHDRIRPQLSIAFNDINNVRVFTGSLKCDETDVIIRVSIRSLMKLRATLNLSEQKTRETIISHFHKRIISPNIEYPISIDKTYFLVKFHIDTPFIFDNTVKNYQIDIRCIDSNMLLQFSRDDVKELNTVVKDPTNKRKKGGWDEIDEENSTYIPISIPDPVTLGIGGLSSQFTDIFRRAFISRTRSTHTIHKMGMKHCRGLILYGPPGTGKTLIARKIAEMLKASSEPTIVSGSELLNKYVGESEKNVRELFAKADADPKGFHVIIIDELDAVFKNRGSTNSSTGINDTIVNQLLTKMDGMSQGKTDSADNFLIVGMTNRLDMLDKALLRPGRFEVQIEIGLPDASGRLDILKIHTQKLDLQGVDLVDISNRTINFSGAELFGLVRTATTWAIQEQNDVAIKEKKTVNKDDIPTISAGNFNKALSEVKPRFGRQATNKSPIFNWSDKQRETIPKIAEKINCKFRDKTLATISTFLIAAPPGAGKTTVGRYILDKCQADFIREANAAQLSHLNELEKLRSIKELFEDAARSANSVVFLDDIEELLDIIGPNYSARMALFFKSLLKTPLEKTRLVVLMTTSKTDILDRLELIPITCCREELQLVHSVNDRLRSKLVSENELPIVTKQILQYFANNDSLSDEYVEKVIEAAKLGSEPMCIKQVVQEIETAYKIRGTYGSP